MKLAIAGVEDDLERLGCCIRLKSVTQASDCIIVGERTVHHTADGRTTQEVVSRPPRQLSEPTAAIYYRLVLQAHVRQQKTLI